MLRIDVRELARRGLLEPGFAGMIPAGRAEITGVIEGAANGDAAALLISGSPAIAAVRVPIDFTACHYGGRRPWFRCPRCATRRAMLRIHRGELGCVGCLRLAYASTRETTAERAIRRAHQARTRLTGQAGSVLDAVPPRPRGRWRRSYERQRDAFLRDQRAALALVSRDLGRLSDRLAELE